MRPVLLLPLSMLVVAGITGCGYEGEEEVAVATTERDLTLPGAASAIEIASPVELRQLRAAPETKRLSHWPSGSVRAARITRGPGVTVAAAPAAAPAAEPTHPPHSYVPNDRELLPGKTVTVIPANTGPTVTAEPSHEFPVSQGRRGFIGIRGRGRCPPRPARGIGIVGVPTARLY